MTSILKSAASLVLVAIPCAAPLAAQQPVARDMVPQPRLSAAEERFDNAVRDFEKHLYDAGAFTVDVESRWTYRGAGRATRGTNLFYLAVKKGGKYRIEAGSRESGKAQYVCVSDGQEVTRIHRPAGYYTRRAVSPRHDELERDALTRQTLAGSGVELLVLPQMRARLISQIATVEFVGNEAVDGQATAHFRLSLIDQRQIDVWFTRQAPPLMVRMATTQQIPISSEQTVELVTTSEFQWKTGGPLDAETFAVTVPAEARRVDDLMSALREGTLHQLLGQPAPALELETLNGERVRLADYRGQKVIVLIFWASWCAPSTNGMDSLHDFVAQAEKGGALVLAVNLGESPEQVRASIAKYGYQGPVLLDPEEKSLDAFGFGELPTTVLIGKEGKVQAFHSGSTPEARQRIRQDTAALLQGKSLESR
jgi:peroxiredoxin